jgi:hypothetical protein
VLLADARLRERAGERGLAGDDVDQAGQLQRELLMTNAPGRRSGRG